MASQMQLNMRPITLQNLTAFLCITGSLVGIGSIGSTSIKANESSSRSVQQSIQQSNIPRWSGDPADELEAEIQLHMRPSTWKFE